jgi:hypothetical protein
MVKRLLPSFQVITTVANIEIQQTHYLAIVCCYQQKKAPVLELSLTAVAQSVVVGAIGAIATADDEAADGYYLVEFTS